MRPGLARRLLGVVVMLALLLPAPALAQTATPPPAADGPSGALPWPRQIDVDDGHPQSASTGRGQGDEGAARSGNWQSGATGAQRTQGQDLGGQRYGGQYGGQRDDFARPGGGPASRSQRDSWARDRGFQRFSGGGFGGFRGFRR